MAEGFGVGAGIVGVLSLTIQISQVVVQFGLDWKDAPNAIKEFMSELGTLKTILSETNTNLTLSPDFQAAFQDQPSVLLSQTISRAEAASETMATVQSCKDALENLLTELKKRNEGSRIGWQRLKGPFLAKKLRETMDDLRHRCQLLNNIVSVDTAKLSSRTLLEVSAARKEQHQWHTAKEHRKILTWLSDLDFAPKQADVLARSHTGTGEWLLRNDAFMAWRNGHRDCPPVLFCPGIPGAGKTVMTSIILDNLQKMFPDDDVSIAYIYCDYKDRMRQSTARLLASLVKQQALLLTEMPEELKKLYEEHHSSDQSSVSVDDCTRLLSLFSTHFRRVFILIDALDEHLTNDDEENVLHLRLLNELLALQRQTKSSTEFSLFVTSRAIPIIEEKLKGALRIDISAMEEDVEAYTRSRIEDDSKFRFAHEVRSNPDLGDTIVSKVVQKTQGMFLHPRLHVDRLNCQTSVRGLLAALESLPSKLYDTYEDALRRIDAQVPEHRDLAISALSWISSAFRPLTIREVQIALAVHPGDQVFDEAGITDESLIVSVSAGLITIDPDSNTIILVHFTVSEFFNSKSTWLRDANSLVIETCLTCLSIDYFQYGIPHLTYRREFEEYWKKRRLLSYAYLNWGLHTARDVVDTTEDSIAKFLTDDRRANAGCQGIVSIGQYYWILDHQLTGLHIAAFLGLKIVSKKLLANGLPVNGRSQRGFTPLALASARGHEDLVVEFLAREDIDVNMTSLRGNPVIPLMAAVQNGQEGVVRQLLKRHDQNANVADALGRTPLSYAAENGYEKIAELLLQIKDVRADSVDLEKYSPLSYAARNGFAGIVELLLRRDEVGVDSVELSGRTALSYAAESGYVDIVKLLLQRDQIRVDSADNMGRTALSYATTYSQQDVVKLLLNRDDIGADSVDKAGRTALSYAAAYSQPDIVKLLLNRDDIGADSVDKAGRTALSYATAHGKPDVVRLLLNRNDIKADFVDAQGRTPLVLAASRGEVALTKLLLARSDVDANNLIECSADILCDAIEARSEAMVKLLIDRSDVDLNKRTELGRLPLAYAAAVGEEQIVKLFLSRSDVKINKRDDDGRTPLLKAVIAVRSSIIDLLLNHNNVDVGAADNRGITPLSQAMQRGPQRIAKLLLARTHENLDKVDCFGKTPFLYALERKDPTMANLMKEKMTRLGLEIPDDTSNDSISDWESPITDRYQPWYNNRLVRG